MKFELWILFEGIAIGNSFEKSFARKLMAVVSSKELKQDLITVIMSFGISGWFFQKIQKI